MTRLILGMSCGLIVTLALPACTAQPYSKESRYSSGSDMHHVGNTAPEKQSTPVAGDSISSQSRHPLDSVRLGGSDLADAGTTGVGMWINGGAELNPALSWAGPLVPIVTIPAKYAMKKGIVATGVKAPLANVAVESGSMFGTCFNLASLAAVEPITASLIGITCGGIYAVRQNQRYQRETGRTLNGQITNQTPPPGNTVQAPI